VVRGVEPVSRISQVARELSAAMKNETGTIFDIDNIQHYYMQFFPGHERGNFHIMNDDNQVKRKASKETKLVENIIEAKNEREKEKRNTSNVIILGATLPDSCPRRCESCIMHECEAPRRRLMVQEAVKEESNVAFFEDTKAITTASIDEEIVLMDAAIDLVIVLPESLGSVAELADFFHNPVILPKMRVFVKKRYHPQHGKSGSYLRDFLRKFDAKGGHVYFFGSDKQLIKDIVDILKYRRGIKSIDDIEQT
jgi:hypothetical protein